jgi:predicted XRE-type DNA-binding protein
MQKRFTKHLRNMERKIEFEQSTGNVFADIGIANPGQALAKAEIARQVNRIIEERKLNQSEAAKILGIDQPKVSALSKGRLSLFSLDKMLQFASRLGNEIEISIKPSEHAGYKVSTASSHSMMEVIFSMIAVGGQNVELAVNLDEQHLQRRSPINMDSSAMVQIEDSANCELVEAA